MRVSRLRLSGLRRFVALDLEFVPGLNLIRGANGSGKSTVLEALGFALFGAPLSRSGAGDDAAIQPGTGELRVEAWFQHRSRRLSVKRVLDAQGERSRLAELASGTTLAEGPETSPAIAALLGLGSQRHLSTLFERLVGIRQGDLTRPLLLSPEERRRHFAPLLDLERPERMATQMEEAAAPFEERVTRLQAEAARGDGALRACRESELRLAAIAPERESSAARIAAIEDRLQALAGEALEADARRQRIETLLREHAVLEEAHRSRAAEEARARAQLDEAEEATRLAGRAEAAHSRFLVIDAECRALEMQRGGQDAARTDMKRIEAELDSERATIDHERRSLDERLENNQHASEALLNERDAIRARLESLRARARRFDGARSALALALERSSRIQQLLAGVVPAVDAEPDSESLRREERARRMEEAARAAQVEAETAEMSALGARAATADDARAALNQAREAAERAEALLREVERTLAAVKPALGACPFLKEPCQNLGGKSLVERFEGEQGHLTLSAATARQAIALADQRLLEARKAAQALADRPRSAGSAPAPEPPRSRPTRPHPRSGAPASTVVFSELGHHLSALSGVLGAIEPATETASSAPRALLGGTTLAGAEGALPPSSEPRLALPEPREIEAARDLSHQAELAARLPARPERDAHLAELAALLARAARRIHASIVGTEAQLRLLSEKNRADTRAGESRLLDSSQALEQLSLERARIRAATKDLGSRDLHVLDLELLLSDRRMRLGGFERIERTIAAKRATQAELVSEHEAYRGAAGLAERAETCRDEWKRFDHERLEAASRLKRAEGDLRFARDGYDELAAARIAAQREALQTEAGERKESLRALAREADFLNQRLAEMDAERLRLAVIDRERARDEQAAARCHEITRRLRTMGAEIGRAVRAQVEAETSRLYRRVMAGGTASLALDLDFGVAWRSGGAARGYADLGRGEQTAASLALLIALLAQFPGLGLLCLDEPTAHLDATRRQAFAPTLLALLEAGEDVLEQVLVVSHDPDLAIHADQVIDLARSEI